jgi:hypothetical protein
MTVELERLSSLATAIEAAERELAAAHRILRQTAAALLRCGEATLAEVSEAAGLGQGELLDLPELAAAPRRHRSRPGIGHRACGYRRHQEAFRHPGTRRPDNR